MKLYSSPSDKAFVLALVESDPKTIHMYFWCYITLIIELDGEVVSLFLKLICYINETLTFFLHKIQFEISKRGDADNDCLLSVDGADFRIASTATSKAMACP